MVGASKFDPMISAIKVNLETLAGELYNLVTEKKKTSGSKVRAAALNISKVCKQLRMEVMDMIKSFPIRKRNITADQIKAIVEKRKATIAGKKRHGRPAANQEAAPAPKAVTPPTKAVTPPTKAVAAPKPAVQASAKK